MHLFVSDMHLGRHGGDDREVERDLVRCLRAHEGVVERLFLLGDVFDYYIEYRHVVPKGFVRLQGLLAEWSDAGIPVTYVVGNHDPWHERYFTDELGVRIVHESAREVLAGRRVYLAHGDLPARRGRVRASIEYLLRHPVPVWIYKTFLPSDLGMLLAKKSSRALNSGAMDVDPAVVDALREFAREMLRTGDLDVVILGHSHRSELMRWQEGTYINTGCWYRDRTFARMNAEGAEICTWDGDRVCSLSVETPTLQA